MYAGCPIIWASKMQSLIALSTTEAEYIALSTALREVISVINLIEELKQKGFEIPFPTPKVECRTFEDNRSCIEIATNHKTRARTKHLSVKLHHFRSHVVNKTITIEHVSTTSQIADIFTKPLPLKQFVYLRDRLMGWVEGGSEDCVPPRLRHNIDHDCKIENPAPKNVTRLNARECSKSRQTDRLKPQGKVNEKSTNLNKD